MHHDDKITTKKSRLIQAAFFMTGEQEINPSLLFTFQ
jgi:hypothetical protein